MFAGVYGAVEADMEREDAGLVKRRVSNNRVGDVLASVSDNLGEQFDDFSKHAP